MDALKVWNAYSKWSHSVRNVLKICRKASEHDEFSDMDIDVTAAHKDVSSTAENTYEKNIMAEIEKFPEFLVALKKNSQKLGTGPSMLVDFRASEDSRTDPPIVGICTKYITGLLLQHLKAQRIEQKRQTIALLAGAASLQSVGGELFELIAHDYLTSRGNQVVATPLDSLSQASLKVDRELHEVCFVDDRHAVEHIAKEGSA
ncbi:hypothetical protein HDU93_006889, partial [Gonapodya sp. JEL0774]